MAPHWAWEGKVQPLVFLFLQKLGGRAEITDEDMREYVDSKYVMRTWYDEARMINMYELVNNATVDGEVVDERSAVGMGQRTIGSAEPGPRGNNGLG